MRIATNHVEHDKVLKSIIIKLSMLIIIAFNSFFLGIRNRRMSKCNVSYAEVIKD